MKTTKWMVTAMLVVAATLVAGAFALVSCAPSTVPEQAGSAGGVSESVSVPATEAPFVLPQFGDGEGNGGDVEPTDEPTATPVVEGTEVPANTALVPFDGDPRVGYYLVEYYVEAVEENSVREARGEVQEFPVMPVFVKTTPEGEGAVAAFLSANGAKSVFSDRDASVGQVAADINIGMIPELLDVEGFVRVDLDLDLFVKRLFPRGSGTAPTNFYDQYAAALAEATRTAPRGAESGELPVVRIALTLWWAYHVDRVVKFLKDNGGENIELTPPDGDLDVGTIGVDISLGVLSEFDLMHGVRRVEIIGISPGPSSKALGDRPESGVLNISGQ